MGRITRWFRSIEGEAGTPGLTEYALLLGFLAIAAVAVLTDQDSLFTKFSTWLIASRR